MTAALENFSIQGGVRLDNTSRCVQVCRLTNRAQEAMVAYVAIQIYISSPRSVDEYTARSIKEVGITNSE